MLHSPDQAAAFTNYALESQMEFDDPLDDYSDGKGSCLASAVVALVVATFVLGFTAPVMRICD
jgi:hypothetical protein